jgi:hypothetical protein
MKLLIVVAAAAMLSACVAEPPSSSALAVADPFAPVPPVGTVSVTAGTADHMPVAPRPWGEVNDRVAPRGDDE